MASPNKGKPMHPLKVVVLAAIVVPVLVPCAIIALPIRRLIRWTNQLNEDKT